MTRVALFAAVVAVFAVLATANSGGYRYGVSDQAFYIPALALEAHPDLFPRDRVLLEPQMRLWPGGRVLAGLIGVAGDDQPAVFLAVYGLTLALLAGSAVSLARGIGAGWGATGTYLLLLTLRHRIAKTGANSLEGYMHPRMLAFAVGLGALAALDAEPLGRRRPARRRGGRDSSDHGAWFAATLVLAALWQHRRRPVLAAGAAAAVLAGVAAIAIAAPDRFARMDAAWLGVLAEKDYLFPAEWPAYAWVTNLAYPVVLVLIHRRRQRRGLTSPGEDALIAGALGLTLAFLVSVPLAEARIALVVQLQVNRIFWLLDALVALYVAWWLADGAAGWAGRPAAGRGGRPSPWLRRGPGGRARRATSWRSRPIARSCRCGRRTTAGTTRWHGSPRSRRRGTCWRTPGTRGSTAQRARRRARGTRCSKPARTRPWRCTIGTSRCGSRTGPAPSPASTR